MPNPNDLPADPQIQLPDDDDDTRSPARQNEDWKNDPESDDDVDKIGEELGVTYEQDEELNIEDKVPVTTESEPPSEE